MQEWIEKHLTELALEGKSPLTVEGYRIDLQQFQDYMSENWDTVDIPQIDAIHIRGFLIWLSERPNCNRSLSRKLSALASWFKFLKVKGVITGNPMRKIRRPKYENKLPKFFSEDEMTALLRIPDTSTPIGVRNRAMLELLYSCGLRLMELAALRMHEIDFRKKMIRVMGKGSKQRLIPVGVSAIQAIEEYLKLRPDFATENSSDRIFLTHTGKDFDAPQLKVILMHYITLIAREKGYSPHSIRHSFATHMLSHGAELRAIQEMLGHTELSATEVYTHLSLDEIKDAYEKGHPRSGE